MQCRLWRRRFCQTLETLCPLWQALASWQVCNVCEEASVHYQQHTYTGKQEPKHAARDTLHEGTKRKDTVTAQTQRNGAQTAMQIGKISALPKQPAAQRHAEGAEAASSEQQHTAAPQSSAAATPAVVRPPRPPGLQTRQTDSNSSLVGPPRPAREVAADGARSAAAPEEHKVVQSSSAEAQIGPPRPPGNGAQHSKASTPEGGPPRPPLVAAAQSGSSAGNHEAAMVGPPRPPQAAATGASEPQVGPPRPPKLAQITPGNAGAAAGNGTVVVGPPRPPRRQSKSVHEAGASEGPPRPPRPLAPPPKFDDSQSPSGDDATAAERGAQLNAAEAAASAAAAHEPSSAAPSDGHQSQNGVAANSLGTGNDAMHGVDDTTAAAAAREAELAAAAAAPRLPITNEVRTVSGFSYRFSFYGGEILLVFVQTCTDQKLCNVLGCY